MTQRLMFRLLPAQVLLFVVTVSNALVDTLYASNFIGTDAMSAIGLYAPIAAFLGAVNTLIIGGTADLCSLYLGTNRTEKAQGIFSLNMVLTAAVSVVITLVLAVMAFTGASGAWISDEAVRRTFNMYLLGQVIGTYPLLMGSQLSVFLMLENKVRRAVIAGISYEFIRLAGSTENKIIGALSKPGLWLQRLTTKEPTDDMIEVGIASVEAVFDWKDWEEKNF